MIAYTTIESYPKVRRPISPPPPKTPIKTVQELTKFCTQDQFEEFTETLGECAIISDLSQVMVDAIKLGRTCFVKELIRLGLPLSPGYVYEAVGACAKDILETIFESGWDINQPMGTMYPPILSNALNDIEMTTWLLDHQADPNRRCYIDLTPFSCAIQHAPLPVANLLLMRGGDITKGQVLHHALDRKSDTVDVLELLVTRGAPINAIMYRDHQPSWDMNHFVGETPLHKAVYLCKIDAVHYLLSQGADLNIQDVRNQTVMQIATEEMRREISQFTSQYPVSGHVPT